MYFVVRGVVHLERPAPHPAIAAARGAGETPPPPASLRGSSGCGDSKAAPDGPAAGEAVGVGRPWRRATSRTAVMPFGDAPVGPCCGRTMRWSDHVMVMLRPDHVMVGRMRCRSPVTNGPCRDLAVRSRRRRDPAAFWRDSPRATIQRARWKGAIRARVAAHARRETVAAQNRLGSRIQNRSKTKPKTIRNTVGPLSRNDANGPWKRRRRRRCAPVQSGRARRMAPS